MPRRVITFMSVALCAVALAACGAGDARKNATPTSTTNPSAGPVALEARRALLAPSDVPGSYEQLASLKLEDYSVCGVSPTSTVPPVARTGVGYGDAEDRFLTEQIFTFRSGAQAKSFYDTFANDLQKCGEYVSAGSKATVRPLGPAASGDESVSFAMAGKDSGDSHFSGTLRLVQAGPTVLTLTEFSLQEERPSAAGVFDSATRKAVERARAIPATTAQTTGG